MKIPEIIQQLLKLDLETDYDYTIKEHKDKRSLNANAYAWQLMTKIADVMRLSKEQVYKSMLRDYGQPEVDSDGKPIIITVRHDIKLLDKEDFYCKFVGNGEVNDKLFSHYMLLRGSSSYDTKEMAIFIDGIVEEAKQLDIETLTPDMLMEMKGSWE